ncbi:hypothetical protein J5I95_22830 [Candidatus Poribacteria bacterium]|nr:hypothetical protein [Candidatus Poribacteria bacterium]
MSNKYKKWILFLWCFSLSLLYLILHTHLQELLQQHPQKNNKVTRGNVHNSQAPQRHHRLKPLQNSDFYRTIIDNNLFRPLGWTPPRRKEPYRLIGTILPTGDSTSAQAILRTTAGKHKTYIVTIGDKIDDATEVVDIQRKQVKLKTDGKQRTLRLNIRF